MPLNTQADKKGIARSQVLGILLLVGFLAFAFWYPNRGRSSMEEVQIEDCRSRYAAAHSHADTLRVDYHMFPGTTGVGRGRGFAFNNCGEFRSEGRTLLAPLAESTAVRIAREFMQTQSDAHDVFLDSLQVRRDSLEWQVYFRRRTPRLPPVELVAVSQVSGTARRVSLR